MSALPDRAAARQHSGPACDLVFISCAAYPRRIRHEGGLDDPHLSPQMTAQIQRWLGGEEKAEPTALHSWDGLPRAAAVHNIGTEGAIEVRA